MALHSERGSSIIEVLGVTLLLSLVSIFAIPEFATFDQSMQRFNVRNNFLQDLKRMQAEAVTQGCRGILSVTPSNYSFGCDYLPTDTTSPPSADEVRLHRLLPDAISITTSSQLIINARGQAVDENNSLVNVTVQLLDSSGGSPTMFASGTLLGTGLFEYDTY